MLDLAFGLTETSRLGCQIKMAKDIDGIVVKLPSMTRNMQAGVSQEHSGLEYRLTVRQDFQSKS